MKKHSALTNGGLIRRWALVVAFFLCHLVFEGLNEALVSFSNVPHSITLWSVAVQFICCGCLPVLLSGGKLAKENKKASEPDVGIPFVQKWMPYGVISLMVFLANSLSQYATHYVEFTLKIVAKSSKLLPTMLISGISGNSAKYGLFDYAAASLLCLGTALFSYGGNKKGGETSDKNSIIYGIAALGLSCIFDGLVPNAQQRVMQSGISSAVLMARTNFVGAIGSIIVAALSSDIAHVFGFIWESPQVFVIILGIGLSLAGSVMCYTELIASVGSVFTVGVGTLRKTASLLLSYLLFPGKSLGEIRIAGLALVAVGLLLAELQSVRRDSKCKRH